MRVKLAVQVLSSSVSAGMLADVANGILPATAAYTADFIAQIDELFDIFNSRSKYDVKKLRCAISQTSHINILLKAQQMFRTLEVLKPPQTTVHFLHGWKISISALLKLWNELQTNHGLAFLMTSRLNQDPLENLFCVIRQSGGARDNPDTCQFRESFKRTLISHLLKPIPSSNCKLDEDVIFLTFMNLQRTYVTEAFITDGSNSTSLATVDDSQQPTCTEDLATDSAIYYVSGYLLSKWMPKHGDCVTCNELQSKEKGVTTSKQLFTSFKAYTGTTENTFGKLYIPSESFFSDICQMESSFNLNFHKVVQREGIGSFLQQKLTQRIDISKGVLSKCCSETKKINN